MTALHETECIAVRHGVLFSGRKDPAVVRHKKKKPLYLYIKKQDNALIT